MRSRSARCMLLVALSALPACHAPSSDRGSLVPDGLEMRYRGEVDALVEQADAKGVARGGTIVVGSSIVRLWKTVGEDLAPWRPVNHGFGGSRTWELVEYADELVIDFQPKSVIVYSGSNDINAGEDAESIARRVEWFMADVENALPAVEIVYLAINRAPQKRDRWDVVDDANRRISVLCAGRSNRHFVDVNVGLFDEHGEPRLDLYQDDLLHFRPEAYREVFAPGVERTLQRIEPVAPSGP